jgi:hypothetical protein
MFALFDSVHLKPVGTGPTVQEPPVCLFSDRESAIQFAVDRLVDSGDLVHESGVYLTPCREELWRTAAEALDAYQDDLLLGDYFHIYPVQDLRTAEGVTA